LTIVSPSIPSFIKQALESLYKYFSANSPKFASTGKWLFRNAKFDFKLHHLLDGSWFVKTELGFFVLRFMPYIIHQILTQNKKIFLFPQKASLFKHIQT
jgi:hypothetical protein